MKPLLILVISCLFGGVWMPGSAQQQELLILGDMHQTPGIAKRAYQPMVKKVMNYGPDIIMSEHASPGDTAAMGEWHSRYKAAYLAKQKEYEFDADKITRLKSTPNVDLSSEDFADLQEYYLSIGDQANTWMYGYFKKHGATKRFKPVGNQNPDLTFQLMRKLGYKEIYGVDSHEGYAGYWPAWQRANAAGTPEAQKAMKKALRKDTWGSIFSTPFGNLGKYINKPQTLDAYYRVNSLRYAGFSGEDYDIQQKKWDDRNVKMAENILAVLDNSKAEKSVLIVGAGHAKAVREELQRLRPGLKIVMYNDL
ncbi:MAG: hypothetical protein KTR13_03295 [Saprospiraceae bacterium]|nr:hypothetical protein [Saprospiraceae bacterium]